MVYINAIPLLRSFTNEKNNTFETILIGCKALLPYNSRPKYE